MSEQPPTAPQKFLATSPSAAARYLAEEQEYEAELRLCVHDELGALEALWHTPGVSAGRIRAAQHRLEAARHDWEAAVERLRLLGVEVPSLEDLDEERRG